MRILIVRHADPDYVHDSLTEKGQREADLLGELVPSLEVGDCFVSPMGRARETARRALSRTGKEPKVLPWLQEFNNALYLDDHEYLVREAYPDSRLMSEGTAQANYSRLLDPQSERRFAPDAAGRLPKYAPRRFWDMIPSYLQAHPELYDREGWRESEIGSMGEPTLSELYDFACAQLDGLLAQYGYEREGILYRAREANEQTITLFCHMGIGLVFLSHLINTSPFILQNIALAPSSVTELVTEERQEGIAQWRLLRMGDTTHLTMGGERASFAARYCEVYSRMDQRH